MYLTRFMLNPARRASRTLLGSPQAMHAAVLAGFAPGVPHELPDGSRVLWRVDSSQPHQHELFIASPAEPDLTAMVEDAGWPTQTTWETRDYRGLLGRLDAGQTWGFRLTANPVRSIRVHAGKDTQPVGHVTAAHQLEWLVKRAPGLGVDLCSQGSDPSVVVKDRRIVRFRRQGATVTLAQATYDGVLRVVDPDALRAALVRGVGRAKGYGCGLLTLGTTA